MRKPIREILKKEISYRQSYKCNKCSELLPPSFQIDHIIPWSISNDDSEENLQALCPNCHSNKTQKENMRIIQYKKILSNCPNDYKLCWFCLETYDCKIHKCEKIVKDIPKLVKVQSELTTSFEEMCNKYKYVKREKDDEERILKIKITLYDNSIYVNNTIVKFTDEIEIENIVDAVFLSTRSKKYSKKYELIHLTIDCKDEDNDAKEKCLSFIENSDIIERLPPRIFKESINIIYY